MNPTRRQVLLALVVGLAAFVALCVTGAHLHQDVLHTLAVAGPGGVMLAAAMLDVDQ